MTTRQDIITLLAAQLNPLVLLLGSDTASYTVVDYTDPAYLLKMYLLNGKVDVLFTVKRANGLSSRFLQFIAHTEKTDFDIGVWCASKAPQLNTDYTNLRDYAVKEVGRIIKANPAYASEKAVRDDDHTKGNVQVFNTTVTVTNQVTS